ncbi:MAG: hypothetical protein N3A57_07510, partial [Negativicutes bacterium]|nr:hypothetical protein [Negativicutes bacterium]
PAETAAPIPPSYKDLGRTLYTDGTNGYSSYDRDDVLTEARDNDSAYVCGTQLLVGLNESSVKFEYYSEPGEGPPFSHGNYDLVAPQLYVPGIIVVQLVERG